MPDYKPNLNSATTKKIARALNVQIEDVYQALWELAKCKRPPNGSPAEYDLIMEILDDVNVLRLFPLTLGKDDGYRELVMMINTLGLDTAQLTEGEPVEDEEIDSE